MAAADAVNLVFDNKPRVAGETVQGEVHLNFRLLELNEFEEVNVKLRGVVSTQSAGWHKNVDLVCDTLSVWKRGDPEKTPETHVINVPLSFSLRENLLPSGQYGSSHGKSGCTGNVDYYVEVISLPDIDVFPVQSPIPFILTVLTTSKPSQQEDSSKEQAVFPVPPADPRKGIELKLLRRVAVNAGVKKQFSAGDLTVYLGGLGPEAQDDTAQIDPVERTWVPTTENPKYAGFWRQEAKFRSTFTLDCAPSFEFRTIKAYYTMHIKVNFPGVGNDVEFQFPADLVSNRPLPPQEVPPPYHISSDGIQDPLGTRTGAIPVTSDGAVEDVTDM
ncbi:hypothetical protein EW026_g1148 [Hermanssonia centrifuga]|uniref:Arrestin-like N-terminal domain-containing protein n=1 Tax=Hermanssonia centrifuga TaxID=98765 RepID=A0A4S4KSF0_9APHY|nr:hypothetical protein EW026_g1148 [Hermanssonia centrifuga]